MTGWVKIEELKADSIADLSGNDRDDAALTRVLLAAQEWVEARRTDLTFTDPAAVPAAVKLGTMRLAARWWIRRNSPDGTASVGDMGVYRVGKEDSDIMSQLGILPVFG